MKNLIISLTIVCLGFSVVLGQTKAVIPKGLVPSTSMVTNMKDGAIVISEQQDLYPNGQMKSSGMHTARNKKTGTWYGFREDGSVVQIANYLDGVLYGKSEWYDESNNLTESGYFENDIAVKTWNTYHQNGKVKMTGEYINGKREGKWPIYYDNGKLLCEVVFVNGEKNGVEKTYFEDAKLESEVNWKNGLLDGTFVQYQPNGNKKMTGAHIKGEKTGHWVMYNEDGSVSQETDF